MSRLKVAPLTIALVLSLAGCRVLWDLGNRSGLKADVGELLGSKELAAQQKCRMIGATRGGTCTGELPLSSIEEIAGRLNLTEVKGDMPVDHDYESWLRDGGWNSEGKLDGMRIFKSKRRAPELNLKSGRSFEYLLLLFNPSDGKSCVQVSYAYG